jgi:hypothetical protein
LSKGFDAIEYKGGRRVNVASYSEMAIRTANKRAYIQAQGDKRRRWGIALVQVAPNGAACPQCMPWLGKVLVDDVWSGGTPDGIHELMSEAIAAGLYHPNCRDVHSTYFGDEEDYEYTAAQQEADAEQYTLEQAMRADAAGIQRSKRLETGLLEPKSRQRYTERIQQLASTWNAHARAAKSMGILPLGFIAAGKAWESIKASIRSVYVRTDPHYADAFEDAARTIGSKNPRLVRAELARRDSEWVRNGTVPEVTAVSDELMDKIERERPWEKRTAERLTRDGYPFEFQYDYRHYYDEVLKRNQTVGLADDSYGKELKWVSPEARSAASVVSNAYGSALRKEGVNLLVIDNTDSIIDDDAIIREARKRIGKLKYPTLVIRKSGMPIVIQ